MMMIYKTQLFGTSTDGWDICLVESAHQQSGAGAHNVNITLHILQQHIAIDVGKDEIVGGTFGKQ